MKKIVISSCLLGECTKYNGGHNINHKLLQETRNFEVISVCPEELGGLSTPRPPAEIIGGDGFTVLHKKAKVVNSEGCDVSKNFIDGAYKILNICRENSCNVAILKANSPSCSKEYIYDGNFNKSKITGVGVTTALLILNNIKVYSEEDYLDGLFKRD